MSRQRGEITCFVAGVLTATLVWSLGLAVSRIYCSSSRDQSKLNTDDDNESSNTTTNVGGHSIVENNADFEESGKNIVLNAAAFAQAYAYSAYDDI